jgi:hypothetical protein
MDDEVRNQMTKISEIIPGLRPWILGEDGRTPVQTDFIGYMEWAESVGGLSAKVKVDTIGETTVSTVFLDQFALSADRNREPKLFETLVSYPDGEQNVERRYTTWDEAERGHEEILEALTPGSTNSRHPTP